MIDLVDKLYKASAECVIRVHAVSNPQVREFFIALRKLQRASYNYGEEELWAPLLRLLKAYRYRCACAPLPLNHPAILGDVAKAKVQALHTLLSSGASPESRTAANEACQTFNSASSFPGNPLGDKFYEIVQTSRPEHTCAAVLLENDLVQHSRSIFAWGHAKDICFLSPFELRRNAFYDRLIVFGAPQWYSRKALDFLFHAPRSLALDVVAFRWISSQVPPAPSFPGKQPPLYKGVKFTGVTVHQPAEPDPDLEDAQVVFPTLNVEKIKKAIGGPTTHTSDTAEDEEETEARLGLLTGNKAVFLEIDDSASSYVIDFSGDSADADVAPANTAHQEEAETYFGRRLNSDLEPGMFLLLRTEGGGDLVQQYAERILKAIPEYKPELQAGWKTRLAARLHEDGLPAILAQLLANGGTLVTLQTIRNWKSSRNIRPDSPNFEALLKVLGLAASTDAIAQNAKFVRRSRMSAGMHIRSLLLAVIKNADLSALSQEGSMTFYLPHQEGGGSMTAFRLEKLLPDTHMIPYNRIGHAFELTEDLWH